MTKPTRENLIQWFRENPDGRAKQAAYDLKTNQKWVYNNMEAIRVTSPESLPVRYQQGQGQHGASRMHRREILALLHMCPGIHQREIARALQLGKSTVNEHILVIRKEWSNDFRRICETALAFRPDGRTTREG